LFSLQVFLLAIKIVVSVTTFYFTFVIFIAFSGKKMVTQRTKKKNHFSFLSFPKVCIYSFFTKIIHKSYAD